MRRGPESGTGSTLVNSGCCDRLLAGLWSADALVDHSGSVATGCWQDSGRPRHWSITRAAVCDRLLAGPWSADVLVDHSGSCCGGLLAGLWSANGPVDHSGSSLRTCVCVCVTEIRELM